MTHSISYRRLLNKMGYYNYQNGLIYNHINQEGGWDNHQERCRSFIIKALDFYKPEKVTVLGSGWLLELPFTELVERTQRVCLVDIIHPPDVISQTGSFKNVELIEQDITGGLIEEVWQKTRKYSFFNKLQSLENVIVPEYKPDCDPGMVISLNILTQLESQLVDFLRKKSRIKEEEFNIFRTEIQKKHIDFLKKNKSVLITDITEIFTDNSGNVTKIPTVITDLPDEHFKEEWTWHFDLVRSDYYTKRSVFKIVGIII
ncbi:MAG: hypothetical protein ABSF81_01395 [Bacteroidales bacterium]|jgi:hypothetical protein